MSNLTTNNNVIISQLDIKNQEIDTNHASKNQLDINEMSLKDAAIFYANLGWHVFPCQGKIPLLSGKGVYDATNDIEQITKWWTQFPDANIGVHCGVSGFVALDIDSYKDNFVADSIDFVTETVTNLSGKGGQHLLYKIPVDVEWGNRTCGLPDGIDVRGFGGYIIIPPSIHPDTKKEYQWELDFAPNELDLLAMPDSLVKMFDASYEADKLRSERISELSQDEILTDDELVEKFKTASNWPKFESIISGDDVHDKGKRSDLEMTLLNMLAFYSRNSEQLCRLMDSLPLTRWQERNDKQKLFDIEKALVFVTETYSKSRKFDSEIDHVLEEWPNYAVKNNSIIFRERKWNTKDQCYDITEKTVSDFYATITQVKKHEISGEIYTISGGSVRGDLFSVDIASIEFNETKAVARIEAAAGPLAAVNVNMRSHVPVAIKKLSTEPKYIYRFSRTGWFDGRFLIDGLIGDDVEININPKLCYSVQNNDLERGKQALFDLLVSMGKGKGMIVLSTMLLAPFSQLCGFNNERYALFFKGRTGTGKTSHMQAFMSIYGQDFMDDSNLIKFGDGATNNALMKTATEVSHLPFFIDNYKPQTGKKDAFVSFIHNVLEGGDRMRLNADSEFKEAKAIHSWPIATGEDVPNTDAATMARSLVVDMDWSDDWSHLTDAQNNSDSLSSVGFHWLNWIQTDEAQTVAQWAKSQLSETRSKWGKYLRKLNPDSANINRVATNIAINELCIVAAESCGFLTNIIDECRKDYHIALCELAQTMSTATSQSLEAVRWMDTVNELLNSGQAELKPEGQPVTGNEASAVVGWHDGSGGCYLLPTVLRNFVNRYDDLNNISSQQLYSQLSHLGVVAKVGKKGTLYQKKIAGNNQKVLHLNSKLFGESEE